MSDDNKAFDELEKEKIITEIKTKALSEVEKAKEDLIANLQGKKPKYSWEEQGRDKPSNYDELFDEFGKKIVTVKPEDVDARVEAKLKEREDLELKKQEEERKAQEQTAKQKADMFDTQWSDLVSKGLMPDVAPELKARIQKGERLTREEIEADEGLKSRLELAKHVTDGKTAKEAFYEDYNKQPAGANAPVFGGRPPTSQSSNEDFDYDEISSSRKKIFGF